MEQSLTQGNMVKTLVSFTIPLIISGMLQQIFNWVDAFIVGNVEGELALAGIGATTYLYNLFVTVIVGFTSGITVFAAQRFGMGERETLRDILSAFTFLLGGVFLAVAAAGILLVDPILIMLDTPAVIFHQARAYMQPLLLGIPCLAVYNTYSAVLRSMGDSKAPFYSILVCSGVNVVLDLFFVAYLRLGTGGAAAATALSQAVMTIFIIGYAVKRHPVLRFRPGRSAVLGSVLAMGLGFAVPPTIQAGTTSLGNMLLQRFMNGFGEQVVAAVTTAYRIDTVLILPIVNFGSGIATITAQNIGANNRPAAKQALKIGMVMMAVISLCLTAFVVTAGEGMIRIFGLTPEAVSLGKVFFGSIARFYIVYGLAMAMRGYLEGLGDMRFSSMAGIAALGVRILSSYAFKEQFHTLVIAYAEAFSWIALLGMYLLRFVWKETGNRGVSS